MDNNYIISFQNVIFLDDKKNERGPFSFNLFETEGALIICSYLDVLKRAFALATAWRKPKKGNIFWWPEDKKGPDKNVIYKYYKFYSQLGILHRQSQMLLNMTLAENITLVYEYREKMFPQQAREKAQAILEKFNLLTHENKLTSMLPEPVRRLAVYALVYATHPKLFIMERPKQFLDRDFDMVWEIIMEDVSTRKSAFIVYDRNAKTYQPEKFNHFIDLN